MNISFVGPSPIKTKPATQKSSYSYTNWPDGGIIVKYQKSEE